MEIQSLNKQESSFCGAGRMVAVTEAGQDWRELEARSRTHKLPCVPLKGHSLGGVELRLTPLCASQILK